MRVNGFRMAYSFSRKRGKFSSAAEYSTVLTTESLQIATNLPDSEEMFQAGQARNTPSLTDVLQSRSSDYSPLAATAASSALLGRIINHLHQPWATKETNEVREKFCKSHREIEGALMQLMMSLPYALRIPHGLSNPNVQFLHINLRVCTICLNQTSMLLARKYQIAAQFVEESRMRCVTAANDITSIMLATCHQNLTTVSPLRAGGG